MDWNSPAPGTEPDDVLGGLVADALALTMPSPAEVNALGRAAFRQRRPTWPAPLHLAYRPPRTHCSLRLLDQ